MTKLGSGHRKPLRLTLRFHWVAQFLRTGGAAMQCGISRADIELTAAAFSAHQQFGMK